MAVLFKDTQGANHQVYLVDFAIKEIAPFCIEGGFSLEHLENDSVEWFGTYKFSDKEGQAFIKGVRDGNIVQVDFTETLMGMLEPESPVEEDCEPKEGVIHFYRSEGGRGIAVDFFNGIWAPISICPAVSVKSLIHYPLTQPTNYAAFRGELEGKLVPEMIKEGLIKLEKKGEFNGKR